MTLLEIMLALLVLVMVVSMVSLSLTGSLKVMDATRDQGDLYNQARIALQRISEDLASAVPANGVAFQGARGDLDGHRADGLQFASYAHVIFDTEHDHQGLSLISYRVRPDDQNGRGLILVRSDRLLMPSEIQGENGHAGHGFILCDRLRSVSFSFRDEKGDQTDNWDTGSENAADSTRRRLPVSVTCTLEFWLDRKAETSLTFSTSILLPVGLIQARSGSETGGL